MMEFFWSAHHLGWACFLLLAYSGVCLLAGDLVWRLFTLRGRRLAGAVAGGWLAGVVLIVACARWAGLL